MAGLRLRGIIGLPLHRLPREAWHGNASAIIAKVYDALTFAHDKSIFHLDVQPGNVIVEMGDRNVCNVMLSDWGCAVVGKTSRSMKYFRGCTPYAHDRLLGKFQGRLDSALDMASLAYTVDHVKSGRLRWIIDFDRPSNVNTSKLETRRNFVRDWLGKDGRSLQLDDSIVSAMRSACGLPACSMQTRSMGTKNS